jgi:hypothetical protein
LTRTTGADLPLTVADQPSAHASGTINHDGPSAVTSTETVLTPRLAAVTVPAVDAGAAAAAGPPPSGAGWAGPSGASPLRRSSSASMSAVVS